MSTYTSAAQSQFKTGGGTFGNACASRSTGESSGPPKSLLQQRPCVLSERGHCPSQLLRVSHLFFLGGVAARCTCSSWAAAARVPGLAPSPGWFQLVQFFAWGSCLLGSASGERVLLGSSGIKPHVSLVAVLVGVSWPFCSSRLSFAWPSHTREW